MGAWANEKHLQVRFVQLCLCVPWTRCCHGALGKPEFGWRWETQGISDQFNLSFSSPLESKHGKLLFHSNSSKLLTVKVFLTSVFPWWALWFHLGTQKPRYYQFLWQESSNGAPTPWQRLRPSGTLQFLQQMPPQLLVQFLILLSRDRPRLGTLWFPVTSSQHQKAGEQMWRQRVSNPPSLGFQEVSLAYYHHSYVFCFLSSTLLGPVISWCPLLLSIIRQRGLRSTSCQRQNWDPTSFLAHWIRSHSTKSVLFMFSGSTCPTDYGFLPKRK